AAGGVAAGGGGAPGGPSRRGAPTGCCAAAVAASPTVSSNAAARGRRIARASAPEAVIRDDLFHMFGGRRDLPVGQQDAAAGNDQNRDSQEDQAEALCHDGKFRAIRSLSEPPSTSIARRAPIAA